MTSGNEVRLQWTDPAPLNEGFLLREDAALKSHLQGIRVRDSNSPAIGRLVPVYFRLPEQEARRREYPYITIDLLSATRDHEREHRGRFTFQPLYGYNPVGRVPGEVAVTDLPIPMSLTYQVTTFARFVQHDRQLMARMMTEVLPERFGSLSMVGSTDFDDDNSIRRMDFLGGPVPADSPDPQDPNKRIFRKAYTVAVSSEIFYTDLLQLQAVTSVIVDLQTDPPVND